jgi:hypothetical protein
LEGQPGWRGLTESPITVADSKVEFPIAPS